MRNIKALNAAVDQTSLLVDKDVTVLKQRETTTQKPKRRKKKLPTLLLCFTSGEICLFSASFGDFNPRFLSHLV